METAQSLLKSSDTASRGFSELNEVFDYLGESTKDVQFDITLARGLDYYTGFICEVNSNESEMGSIGGGGRYDNLTEMFGLKNMSGVGVSLGAERIYDIMLELGKFPDSVKDSANAIFVSFDEESLKYSYKMAQELRQSDIDVDIYPEATKIGKQMKYADQRGFKYAVLVGSNERQADRYLLRNMKSGDEKLVDAEELKRELKIY
jgi:histidyl-tRNA synthetase